MAKLQLRYYPDEVLTRKAKKITRFDASVRKLAQEMLDTMYENDGVGLAAPQVGVSQSIMVIDVSGAEEVNQPLVFVNPRIVEKEGEIVGLEGCLSFPGVYFEIELSKHGFGGEVPTGLEEHPGRFQPNPSTSIARPMVG